MNKLKKLRQQKKVSQSDVAKQIGITTSYYGMIELEVRKPSLQIAQKLAVFFNCTIEEIFFANQNNS